MSELGSGLSVFSKVFLYPISLFVGATALLSLSMLPKLIVMGERQRTHNAATSKSPSDVSPRNHRRSACKNTDHWRPLRRLYPGHPNTLHERERYTDPQPDTPATVHAPERHSDRKSQRVPMRVFLTRTGSTSPG